MGEPRSAAEERRESRLYTDSASDRLSMTASGALPPRSSTVRRSRAPRSTTGAGGGGHSEKPSRESSEWAQELEGERTGWRKGGGEGDGEQGKPRDEGRFKTHKKWESGGKCEALGTGHQEELRRYNTNL